MNDKIPTHIEQAIRKEAASMIAEAQKNKSGVSHCQTKTWAMYIHTAAVPTSNIPPGSVAGQDMVYVEWYAMAGYAHDGLTFRGAMLRSSDDKRICRATISFAEALAL